MKDFIISKNDTSLVGTLRVDALSNSPANFQILEMYDADGKSVDSINLIGGFYKKLPISFPTFLKFCADNNLRIDAKDSNGSNPATLLLNQKPDNTYNIVSANSGTKTILIATDVHADFLSGDNIVIYNSDNTIFGEFTVSADSTYSAPNTSVVVTEAITAIATNSGKYLVNNGQ